MSSALIVGAIATPDLRPQRSRIAVPCRPIPLIRNLQKRSHAPLCWHDAHSHPPRSSGRGRLPTRVFLGNAIPLLLAQKLFAVLGGASFQFIPLARDAFEIPSYGCLHVTGTDTARLPCFFRVGRGLIHVSR